MVMEFEGLASTRWTSNTPRPFARAPGSGTQGLSGFAASPATIQGDDILVTAKKWAFEVVRLPIEAGKIPSMLLQLRFTDRGTFSFVGQLDAQILPMLKKAGFKTSKATSFTPIGVKWARAALGGDLYYPVVQSPAELAGLRYSGNAVTLPWTSAQSVSASELSKLPSNIYVYTVAVTSNDNTMTDAQGAQALSVIHTWLQNQNAGAYMTGKATVLGSDPSIFPGPITPATAAVSGLALIIAWNMLADHMRLRG